MGQSSEDEETKCQPHFNCLNVAACFVTNPSCASDPQLTLFGLSVTEAVLSAVQADTLYSLAFGFAESETMQPQQSAQRGEKTSSPHGIPRA